MKSWTIQPAKSLRGELTVPGDKSISHRAIILGSLAEGTSRISNLLLGEDVLCTMRIMQQMGVKMSHTPENIKPGETLQIEGVGLNGLKKPEGPLDCGNSGTSMRLLMGLLSVQNFEVVLTGDQSLSRRPMGRVMKPLQKVTGARFEEEFQGQIRFIKTIPGQIHQGFEHTLEVASAQVKSALMLAGLFAKSATTIVEPTATRDHTERMMQSMGAQVVRDQSNIRLTPVDRLKPLTLEVPGDISSAAFFMIAALIVPSSHVVVKNVGINPTRSAVIDVLSKMGGKMALTGGRDLAGEPVADILCQSSRLQSVNLAGDVMANIIDEVPILAVAAARAEGVTSIREAHELRVKESDRISTVVNELSKLGIIFKEYEDGMDISGGSIFGGGVTFESHGDHRIAMSTAVASLLASEPCTVNDVDCVATSFPHFYELLNHLTT